VAKLNLKVAISSCGSIARRHAKNLQGRVDLYFHSRSFEKSAAMAREFGGQAFKGSFEDLVSEDKINGIIICSPPELHFDQAKLALQASKNVLVEKPLCVSPEELELLDQCAQENPKSFLGVAENYYYKPSFKKLRGLIERGAIGDLRRLDIKKLNQQNPRAWKTKFGALLEGGIHFVALMNGLVEKPYLKLKAEIGASEKIERSSSLLVEYENGVQARLRYAWNRPALLKGLFQHSRIEGSEGEFRFESNGIYINFRSYRVGAPAFMPFLKDIAGYRAMVENFIAKLQGREEFYSDFGKAKRDLRLVFDAYRLNARTSMGELLSQ